MKSPRAAVVIPCFNIAPYIRAAVESALAQTVSDIEVVVVDDGSTDGSRNQLDGLNDPRLRIISIAHSGLQTVRNTGIRETSAPYVGILDGDDLWWPEKLEKHLALMEERPDLDMTFSRSLILAEDGRTTPFLGDSAAGVVQFEDLCLENMVRNGSAAVMRRSALEQAGEFDTALPASGDRDMWLRIALLRDGNIHCLTEPLTLYRRRPGQVTRDWRRLQRASQMVDAKMERIAPDRYRVQRGRAMMNWQRYLAFVAYDDGANSEALSLLRRSFRQSGVHWLLEKRSWLLSAAILFGLPLSDAGRRRARAIGFRIMRFLNNAADTGRR